MTLVMQVTSVRYFFRFFQVRSVFYNVVMGANIKGCLRMQDKIILHLNMNFHWKNNSCILTYMQFLCHITIVVYLVGVLCTLQ